MNKETELYYAKFKRHSQCMKILACKNKHLYPVVCLTEENKKINKHKSIINLIREMIVACSEVVKDEEFYCSKGVNVSRAKGTWYIDIIIVDTPQGLNDDKILNYQYGAVAKMPSKKYIEDIKECMEKKSIEGKDLGKQILKEYLELKPAGNGIVPVEVHLHHFDDLMTLALANEDKFYFRTIKKILLDRYAEERKKRADLNRDNSLYQAINYTGNSFLLRKRGLKPKKDVEAWSNSEVFLSTVEYLIDEGLLAKVCIPLGLCLQKGIEKPENLFFIAPDEDVKSFDRIADIAHEYFDKPDVSVRYYDSCVSWIRVTEMTKQTDRNQFHALTNSEDMDQDTRKSMQLKLQHEIAQLLSSHPIPPFWFDKLDDVGVPCAYPPTKEKYLIRRQSLYSQIELSFLITSNRMSTLERSKANCTILYGIGGTGKSTLAADYFYSSKKYQYKIFLPSGRLESIIRRIQPFIPNAFTKTHSDVEILEQFSLLLEKHPGGLIVCDNLIDHSVIHYLAKPGIDVLVTSCDRNAGHLENINSIALTPIPVRSYTKQEAVQALEKITGKTDAEYAALAEDLWVHPITIAIVGKYLTRHKMTLERYLYKVRNRPWSEPPAPLPPPPPRGNMADIKYFNSFFKRKPAEKPAIRVVTLEKVRADRLAESEFPDTSAKMQRSIRITFESLSPEANQLLYLLSFLGNAPLPVSYISYLYKVIYPIHRKSYSFKEIRKELTDYGVLRYNKTEEVIEMHDCLFDTLQERDRIPKLENITKSNDHSEAGFLENIVEKTLNYSSDVESELIPHFLALANFKYQSLLYKIMLVALYVKMGNAAHSNLGWAGSKYYDASAKLGCEIYQLPTIFADAFQLISPIAKFFDDTHYTTSTNIYQWGIEHWNFTDIGRVTLYTSGVTTGNHNVYLHNLKFLESYPFENERLKKAMYFATTQLAIRLRMLILEHKSEYNLNFGHNRLNGVRFLSVSGELNRIIKLMPTEYAETNSPLHINKLSLATCYLLTVLRSLESGLNHLSESECINLLTIAKPLLKEAKVFIARSGKVCAQPYVENCYFYPEINQHPYPVFNEEACSLLLDLQSELLLMIKNHVQTISTHTTVMRGR